MISLNKGSKMKIAISLPMMPKVQKSLKLAISPLGIGDKFVRQLPLSNHLDTDLDSFDQTLFTK